MLKKAGEKNNVFVLAPRPAGPASDPYTACWNEIYQHRDAHWAEWLSKANSTCKTQLRCITCPESGIGLFVMFEIKPTSIKCKEIKVEHAFVKFDFKENVYDTQEVYQYIQKM